MFPMYTPIRPLLAPKILRGMAVYTSHKTQPLQLYDQLRNEGRYGGLRCRLRNLEKSWMDSMLSLQLQAKDSSQEWGSNNIYCV